MNRNQKLGMTNFQIGILFFLGIIACAVLGSTSFLVFNEIEIPSSSNTTIIGKWESYEELTPTPTTGATPTPEIQKDIFGNSFIVPTSANKIVIKCSFIYPPNIEFFNNKTYAGTSSMLSEAFIWQGGQYEILEDGRIKMQTKNGFAVYEFTIEENKITFTDDTTCKFSYTKSIQ